MGILSQFLRIVREASLIKIAQCSDARPLDDAILIGDQGPFFHDADRDCPDDLPPRLLSALLAARRSDLEVAVENDHSNHRTYYVIIVDTVLKQTR